MKRWVKGFAITGAVLLCAGTGMTAVAGAVGGESVRIDNVWELRDYYLEHVSRRLPGWLDREISDGLDEMSGYNGLYHAVGDVSGLHHDRDWEDGHGWPYDDGYDDGDYDDDDWEAYLRDAGDGWHDADGVWHDRGDASHHSFPDMSYGGLTLAPKEEMTLMGSYEGVSELEVQALGAYVKVVENPDLRNQINIYMKEKEKCRVIHRTDDHPYEVEVIYEVYDNRSRLFDDGKYAEGIVEIPAGYKFNKLELKASASILEVPAARAEELKLDAEAGTLSLPSFEASVLKAEADAGAISASGSVSRGVEAEANAGQIELSLEGRKEDYGFILDNEMGSILVDGVRAKESVSGGGTSGKTVKLESSMGSIDVKFR